VAVQRAPRQELARLVLVGAYCALRIGELAGLASRSIDVRGGTLDVAGVVEVTSPDSSAGLPIAEFRFRHSCAKR